MTRTEDIEIRLHVSKIRHVIKVQLPTTYYD